MTRILVLLTAVLMLTLPARAQEEIVAGLSQSQVSITATFVGSEILIYGAVKRDTPPPEEPLGVAIVVEGPSQAITVRRKSNVAGIWVNTDAVEIPAAPSFYAVATSGPLDEVVTPEVDHANHISIPESIRVMHSNAIEDTDAFAEAVVRIRSGDGLYAFDEGAVTLAEDTLFNASIALPANVTEGRYKARIYLTRGGEIVARDVAEIAVRKVGLERWLYNLAHEQALIYGLMSLAIAIVAGWAASAFFRYILRN